MGLRRKSREAALKIIYQREMSGYDIEECIKLYWENLNDIEEIKEFGNYLARGVLANLDKIDSVIASVSTNWSLNRMHKVDLCILRLAVFEMLFCMDIPLNVSINEAIELAKKFSSDDAKSFVNGLLARVADDLRKGGRT